MIEIAPGVTLDENELEFSFIRASGPGGQNVNKVSSAVQMRFDARRSPSLSNDVSIRLQKLAGSKLTLDGVIVITANRFRTQEMNRKDATERLAELITKAAVAPVKRRPTKPTKAAKERRLEGKARRSGVKAMRGKPIGD
jgi:ribosome-associated protein